MSSSANKPPPAGPAALAPPRDNPLNLPILSMHAYQPNQVALDSALGLHLKAHHVQSTRR